MLKGAKTILTSILDVVKRSGGPETFSGIRELVEESICEISSNQSTTERVKDRMANGDNTLRVGFLLDYVVKDPLGLESGNDITDPLVDVEVDYDKAENVFELMEFLEPWSLEFRRHFGHETTDKQAIGRIAAGMCLCQLLELGVIKEGECIVTLPKGMFDVNFHISVEFAQIAFADQYNGIYHVFKIDLFVSKDEDSSYFVKLIYSKLNQFDKVLKNRFVPSENNRARNFEMISDGYALYHDLYGEITDTTIKAFCVLRSSKDWGAIFTILRELDSRNIKIKNQDFIR
jgi:hypothetical protein